MNKIIKRAKQFVKRDGVATLPVFNKNADGEYESIGQVDVSTLRDLREYLATYSEIAKVIRENYRKEILDIYKGALKNLIFTRNRRGYLLEDYKEGLTDDQFEMDEALGLTLPYRTLNRLLTSGLFSKKKYRPGKGITEYISRSVNDGLYLVLPEMTENGVVVVPDKTLSSLAIRFNKYSVEDAAAIKTEMLKAAYEIADPEICAMADEKIKQMFELSMQANMKEICAGKLIKQLAQISVELMGTDMSLYEKKKAEQSTETSVSSKSKTMALSANVSKTITEKVNMSDENINELIIDGLNLISQKIDDGKISTVITPADGSLGYKIIFSDEKAYVSQVSEKGE